MVRIRHSSKKDLERITKELPGDILFTTILPRLPAKSQSRFKCVSKQWHSFLKTPEFRKMHIQHVIDNDRQNNQKLLLLPNNRPWDSRTLDCETPEDGFTAGRPLPFKVEPGQEMSIVSSLHGMVCVALSKPNRWSELSDLILWNPFTDDYKTLSRAGSHNDCYDMYRVQFGLYYCSSKDDYSLLCVSCHPNVYIYSLKSDSWRYVESTSWYSHFQSYHFVPNVFFNEKVYFLCFNPPPAPASTYSLMAFDTQTEKLNDIASPHLGNQRANYMCFKVVRNCIHLCLGIRNSIGQHYRTELWRMDGDGDWTMVECSSVKEELFSYDKPQHLMRNGNWLTYCRTGEGFKVVDMKKHTQRNICPISIAFHPAGKYIENIASPNQYLNFTDDLDQEDDVEDDLKDMEGRKYKWGFAVPRFNQFVGVFMFFYSHLSNWNRRQIISICV